MFNVLRVRVRGQSPLKPPIRDSALKPTGFYRAAYRAAYRVAYRAAYRVAYRVAYRALGVLMISGLLNLVSLIKEALPPYYI
jgi:hypothetical protein